MKDGQMVLSFGGADLFEVTSVVARGKYPPGVELFVDPQEWFILAHFIQHSIDTVFDHDGEFS